MYTMPMLRSRPAPSPAAQPQPVTVRVSGPSAPASVRSSGIWQTERPKGRGSRQPRAHLGITTGLPRISTPEQGIQESLLVAQLRRDADQLAFDTAESPQARILRLHGEERGAHSNIESVVRAEMESRLAVYFARVRPSRPARSL